MTRTATYREALYEALREEMTDDSSVIMLGEDFSNVARVLPQQPSVAADEERCRNADDLVQSLNIAGRIVRDRECEIVGLDVLSDLGGAALVDTHADDAKPERGILRLE